MLRTLAAGNAAADELLDLLGSPLDAVRQDKALAIVRSSEGVESAMVTARDYVRRAEDACARLTDSSASDALRAASRALLDSAAVHA